MLLGTVATVLVAVCMICSPNIYVASISPVIFNGLIVRTELYWFTGLPFWSSALDRIEEKVIFCRKALDMLRKTW